MYLKKKLYILSIFHRIEASFYDDLKKILLIADCQGLGYPRTTADAVVRGLSFGSDKLIV